jgi:hypothetical protein
MVNLYIEEGYQPNAVKLFRADYDFFRHAGQKPQDDYEFTEEWVDFLLTLSIDSYEFLGRKKTEEMRTFMYWFATKYPRWLKKDHPFTEVIRGMCEISSNTSKKDYYIAFRTALERQ